MKLADETAPSAKSAGTGFVSSIEDYFQFDLLGTNWKTEILAGFTTFLTMAYIVFVNPSILKDAGMPVGGVFAATCLSPPSPPF